MTKIMDTAEEQPHKEQVLADELFWFVAYWHQEITKHQASGRTDYPEGLLAAAKTLSKAITSTLT